VPGSGHGDICFRGKNLTDDDPSSSPATLQYCQKLICSRDNDSPGVRSASTTVARATLQYLQKFICSRTFYGMASHVTLRQKVILLPNNDPFFRIHGHFVRRSTMDESCSAPTSTARSAHTCSCVLLVGVPSDNIGRPGHDLAALRRIPILRDATGCLERGME
jgi:hypothetical protein